FGAVFESTLNPVTRRAAGMHYTSLENIHKVIDPLFLDDLRNELQTIKQSARNRKKNLLAFQDKLASLKIFDPACGSGNFLTESYLSLRRLENDVLKELFGSQIQLGEFINPIKISIGQFFGIEINDFAVAVAQTALWIAELQMIQETQEIIHHDLDFLPLKSYANIHEGNALKLDWKEICPQPNFIIGNPPFVGFKFASKSQKEDMQFVFKNSIKPALLDYVCCWYKKAADFIQGTNIEVTFVSTNSVSQGKMAGDLWSLLLESVTINFAWQSFIWDSESIQKAHVHCVVIGFAAQPRDKKILYSGERKSVVENISPYLIDSPNILVTTRNKPLHDVPEIIMGNQAMDGGNLIIEAADYENFIAKEPLALPYIKRYMMGNEFINGKLRWCLWLVNCPPNKLRKMPLVLKRVEAVKNFRAASKDPGARKKAETPTLFREQRNPKNFIAIPITSSERRKYIPIGYLDDSIIAGNTVFIIPDATIYHFGVLTSSVHMAWMRTVGARLKSDYRYSKDIVYNNFPWPEPSPAQRRAVETAAQKILYVRKNYPDATLADLYDPLTMPKDLRDAHKKNDSAVAAAYGLENLLNDEPMIVAELLKLYKKLSE
ncbi:MAG: class I SAM-dependent DNA methyltransferase, partial [Selenomonadaceae bacterium]|nr:class I SAM-dependent DNA methyltransferase [Selenomonadaceae bacterium]